MTLTKKKNALHARRLALARLPDKEIIAKMFSELGPRFADRPGGYTRIIKLHYRRLGDGGKTAIIEFLRRRDQGEAQSGQTGPAAPKPAQPEPAPAASAAPEPTPPAAEATSAPTPSGGA